MGRESRTTRGIETRLDRFVPLGKEDKKVARLAVQFFMRFWFEHL